MAAALKANNYRKLKIFIFLAAVFTFIMLWACVQPFNVSPDEAMRFDIVEFIVKHGYLPHGADPEIRDELWGFSYAFYPILSYMIMAIPAKIVSLFSSDSMAMVIAARIVNAVFGTLMAYFVLRISEMLFKDRSRYVFIALAVLLPGVVFVHSYVNNDSLALFSTAWIAYAWVRAMKEGWTKGICVHLGFAIGICALSYFNAYGFILCSIILFFTTILIGNKVENKAKVVLTRTLIIVLIVFAVSLWWFIRNYILYGDPIGWSITGKYAEMYAADGFKPSQRLNLAQQGFGPIQLMKYDGAFAGNWTISVIISFIGTFGYLNLFMPTWLTVIYAVIIFAGAIGIFTCLIRTFRLTVKTDKGREFNRMGMFNWCMLFVIIITIALLIYYNLYSDLQAQGRYLLPMVIPLMYFVTKGIKRLLDLFVKNEKVRSGIYIALTLFLIFGAVFTFITVFYPAYRC